MSGAGWWRQGLAVLLLAVSVSGHAAGPAARAPVQGCDVERVYPHDRNAFTQGLIWLDGVLYESTGLNGASSVRKVQLETGRVLARHDLDNRYFGEGLTAWGSQLIQLTYRSGLGFVYDRATLRQRQTFRYAGEGWGLTHDGQRLIMSDGTAVLRFLDPLTFRQVYELPVHDGGQPVRNLNELEFVRGEIWANVWRTDRIARIDPQTGRVIAWIDLTGLLSAADRAGTVVDELNGIAWDAQRDRIFVTGKRWPKLFQIRVKESR
ncbi:MAG: glutaminyl-peptide cyclotransferase [Gammaproteobacteria bacterium]|nr:glutaminyl-peptide cyclotransferase [Gammaproteobacteria bacterium]